jgi:hypothetical protein
MQPFRDITNQPKPQIEPVAYLENGKRRKAFVVSPPQKRINIFSKSTIKHRLPEADPFRANSDFFKSENDLQKCVLRIINDEHEERVNFKPSIFKPVSLLERHFNYILHKSVKCNFAI